MHARLVCECGGMWVMWDVGHVGCGSCGMWEGAEACRDITLLCCCHIPYLLVH